MSDQLHQYHVVESVGPPSVRSLLFACLLPLGGCSYELADTVFVGCARRDIANVTESACNNAGHHFASGVCYDIIDNDPDAAVSIHRDTQACSQAGGQIVRFTTSSMGEHITHTAVPVGNNTDAGTDAGKD